MGAGPPAIPRLGIAALVLSVLLTCGGTALPWLVQVEALPPRPGNQSQPLFVEIGLQSGNGWIVLGAGIAVAAIGILVLVRRQPRLAWLLVVPVAVGGIALGDWIAAVQHGGAVEIGPRVCLLGLLAAIPAGALQIHRNGAQALIAAVVLLIALGAGIFAGTVLDALLPIQVYRVF